MRIIRVTPLLISRYLFCEIETDNGLIGLGESGAWAFLEASAAAISRLADYLLGEDPLRIEHHYQYMYRSAHFRGAAIMGAISAIDIALWDIAGKHFGAPTYQLLGGKTRDRARVYWQTYGETLDELLNACRAAKANGMTAVGHLSPFLDEPRSRPYFQTYANKMQDAINRVAAYREAVGNDVDLLIEIHRQLSPVEAIALARGIEPYYPMFYEDPVRPDNFDEMAYVAQRIPIPVATGERLHTIEEFDMLLRRNAVQYVRPDVCLCGGISGAKKIAAMAEACGVGVVPHNPLSPVSTAACIQIAACIPNFVIQEYPAGEDAQPKADIVHSDVHYDGQGHLIIPETPGIGARLLPGAGERHPFVRRPVVARLMQDGSVMDQ